MQRPRIDSRSPHSSTLFSFCPDVVVVCSLLSLKNKQKQTRHAMLTRIKPQVSQVVQSIQQLQASIEDRNGYKIEHSLNPIYATPLALIHECGHHALFPVWGLEWAIVLKSHFRDELTIAPWIPDIRLPFELLPDEQVVKMWTALKAREFGISASENLSKATVLGDHASNGFSDSRLCDIPRFGLQPKKVLSDWCGDFGLEMIDDGFRLPNPHALSVDRVVENWHAIATRYPDRCPDGTLGWIENLPNAWHQLLKIQFGG